ncbi:hypothetical protein [Psychrobacillus sp. FSL K6-2843]|uniref:hypothetical protein n=1 Tax=Psychrobacillus sp. FSL K6-2843 TaxID=2921549 RepID=UPI00315B057D
MREKMKRMTASAVVAASAIVVVSPTLQVEAAINIKQLVVDAQNAGNVLKWAISVEGSADGITQPWEQFNNVKQAIGNAEAAIAKESFSERLKYESMLIEPKIQLQRAQGYLDAITASTKIHVKTNALSLAVQANNLEQVEKAYHEMTAEFRKQTILLDRVYGQSTRDRIRGAVKGPAEKLIAELKNDVTVHMLAKGAEEDMRKNRHTEAAKKIYEAQAILNAETLRWENSLQARINNIQTILPIQVVSVSRVDNTTVLIKLNRSISSVKAAEFTANNGMTVSSATLSGDGFSVTLKTSVQLPGTAYTIKYKTSSVSFTVPGNISPIFIGDQTVQHKETTDVLALTAAFNNASNQSIRIDVPAGLKLISVNGVANNTAGSKSVNATTDNNGVVSIVFTAKDTSTPALDKTVSFHKISKNKVVESQTSGVFNLYSPAKEAAITKKKIRYIDIKNNYFVSTEGVKYSWKLYNDIFQNEGVNISLDSFKAELDIGDVINGTYHLTSSSLFNISANVSVAPVKLDTKFNVKAGTSGYRINASKIELKGTAQPNYELFFFQNNGLSIGKVKADSKGNWTFTANVETNSITDFSILQQPAGKAIPAFVGWGEVALRVIEGPFSIGEVSEGKTKDNDLNNEKITFALAPIKYLNGAVLAQDQATISKQASIIVVDTDGTKVKYTNSQNKTVFSTEKNAFSIDFGPINPKRNGEQLIDKGKDGKLSGPLSIVSIEGVTNEYGLMLKTKNGDQIINY